MQKKTWFWIVWAVVVLAIVGLICLWWYQKNYSLAGRLAKLSVAHPGQVVVMSTPGKLPDNVGFDSDWPDGANPNIISSYVAYYTSSTIQQVTVTYLSKLSYDDNIIAFPSYFARHSWALTSGGTTGTLAYYNAAKRGMTSQIVIEKKTNGVQVTDTEYSPKGF
jgi:hypothetical protein